MARQARGQGSEGAKVVLWLFQSGVSPQALYRALTACGCKAAFAFGSTVRGDATDRSDIDLVLVEAASLEPLKFLENSAVDVENSVGSYSPVAAILPVEAHAWEELTLGVQLSIAREGVCIYEETPGFAKKLRTQTLKQLKSWLDKKKDEFADAAPLE